MTASNKHATTVMHVTWRPHVTSAPRDSYAWRVATRDSGGRDVLSTTLSPTSLLPAATPLLVPAHRHRPPGATGYRSPESPVPSLAPALACQGAPAAPPQGPGCPGNEGAASGPALPGAACQGPTGRAGEPCLPPLTDLANGLGPTRPALPGLPAD